MHDTRCYAVFHRDRPRDRILVESLREVYRIWREKGGDGSGWTYRRRRPKGCKATLEALLAEKGLGHLKVWYRPQYPMGWMVDEDGDEHGMQRIGYTFAQAVEMIRGSTLDLLFGMQEETAP